MKKIKKLTIIIMVIALLFTTSISTAAADSLSISVSDLDGKYIKIDGILFRVLNNSGYAVAVDSNALGEETWHMGFSKILGFAKNKSYIKEARYMTVAEWNTYQGVLGTSSESMWLQDEASGETDPRFNYFSNFNGVTHNYAFQTFSVRPALILESEVTKKWGNDGSIAYPYIMESKYPTGEILPVITVISGQYFDIVIAGGDSLPNSGEPNSSYNGMLSLSNENASDGYIKVRGELYGTGIETVEIEGNKFVFNKIAAPSDATVTATFN